MITRRDVVVALIAATGALGTAAVAQQPGPVLSSTVFDWNAMTVRQTEVGSSRQIVRAPTATLDELEMHITTLNPGQTSHAPHKHVNEELIIIREGTVETLSNGEWKKLGPGSVIFNASNQLHGIKNVGTTPATYHVVNWSSPGILKKSAQP
jgi:quercetin dioxygenase-like cupin family protein